MTRRVDVVLADLAVEGDRLEGLVAPLDDEGWHTATPAEGWDIATTIGHLAWTDEVAVIAASGNHAAWDTIVREAKAGRPGYVDARARAGAAARPTELLARWRSARAACARALARCPDGVKLPWFGPPMSPTSMATARLMETWAHGIDVADTLSVVPTPTDRVRHIVHLGVRTRAFAFANRSLPVPEEDVYVRLVAPSGETWAFGAEDSANRVTGSAWDFALLVTQRRHRDDVDLQTEGGVADQWLDIAQAFAGAPGKGRSPAQ